MGKSRTRKDGRKAVRAKHRRLQTRVKVLVSESAVVDYADLERAHTVLALPGISTPSRADAGSALGAYTRPVGARTGDR